ncbi:MAG: glycosyltransferase [Gemmatimonadaceae bacterium]|nr:glycosyltransferase [Acetobacteraceae bacterium]
MPLDSASPLTVLVLNDFCHVQGGASKVAIDEAVALAQSGARVIFVGAVGPVCDALAAAPLETVCLNQPELLSAGKHPMALLQSMWNQPARRRITALLHGLDPARTIVHLHGYTKALSTSPMLAVRDAGFAAVCTLHDFYTACPNGAFFDYAKQEPCTRRALSASCIAANCDKRAYAHKLFRIVRGVAQRDVARFPTSVRDYITLSDRSASILRDYLPHDAKLHALGNVIDAAPAPAVDAAASSQVVFVGRLDVEKGVVLLAEAAAAIDLPVTFVGDGPLRTQIEATPGMTVTGWLPGSDVKRHLAAARCLVFPSLWYEAYGLVVAEAAAQGVPAIVSDISAAAERVGHGTTGWHFRSGDAQALQDALTRVRDDAAIRAAGSAAYSAFWSDPPTPAAHTAGLLAIYEAILRP